MVLSHKLKNFLQQHSLNHLSFKIQKNIMLVLFYMFSLFIGVISLKALRLSPYLSRASSSTLNAARSGFGQQKKETDISKAASPKILSIPSLSELSKRSEMTKLNFLRDNVYTQTGKKVFDDTVQFPTEFTLKVIGPNSQEFVQDIISVAALSTNAPKESIKVAMKETVGGKYVSITLVPYFNSADELYRCYDSISKDKRIKYVL